MEIEIRLKLEMTLDQLLDRFSTEIKWCLWFIVLTSRSQLLSFRLAPRLPTFSKGIPCLWAERIRRTVRPLRWVACEISLVERVSDIRTMRRFVSGVACLVMRWRQCAEVQSWAAYLFSRYEDWSRAGSFGAAAAINGELLTGNTEWQCGANVLYCNIILIVLKIKIAEIGQFLRWFSTNMVIPLSFLIGQIPSKTQ
jgi:hypothetical protein